MTHGASHGFNILPNVPFGLSKGSGNLNLQANVPSGLSKGSGNLNFFSFIGNAYRTYVATGNDAALQKAALLSEGATTVGRIPCGIASISGFPRRSLSTSSTLPRR
jgi:hypothetical protein